MQVTDEIIEKAEAELSAVLRDYTYVMPTDGMRRVLTAALSDKQAGEVKGLEWNRRNADGTIHIASALPGEYWAWELAGYGYWSWGSLTGREVPGGLDSAKAAAQHDYATRIRAALVDVPAVEPVAWLPADDAPRGVYALIKHRSGQLDLCYKTNNGEPFLETWRYAGTAKRGEQAPWPDSYIPVSDLRTSPPLSREGEDSAEVAAKARTLATAILQHFAAMEDGDGNEAPELAMARDLLAATRSGSATNQKGTGHE